jgi:hypothetical protein
MPIKGGAKGVKAGRAAGAGGRVGGPPKPPTPRPPVVPPYMPGPIPYTPVDSVDPVFGEKAPSADPTKFLDQPHDSGYYKTLNRTLLQPIPAPRDPNSLVLTLEATFGSSGAKKVQAIQAAKKIVFHSAGDTGPTNGPSTLTTVVDKMNADFDEGDPADVPAFFYHLGDVVYNFGEDEYYYDEFYAPFRDYQAPIFAIAGNHDGMVYPGQQAPTLDAFLRNFCSPRWAKLPEAGGLPRTAMIQPGVYFELDAPFVKIIGLYSNVLEGPGVISSQKDPQSPVSDVQLTFLENQLSQAKKQGYKGALIVAVHHPPFTAGAIHGGSPKMLADMDSIFNKTGVYPHAVISGHAHNYQRFTRTESYGDTPYIIAGSGGHAANPLRVGKNLTPIRTPLDITGSVAGVTVKQVTLETYFEHFGYLRVIANDSLLSFEFHEVASGVDSKSPIDIVTVDLKTHKLTTARP